MVRRQLQASTDEVVARQRVHGVAARRHERVEGERLLRTSSLTEPDYDPEGQEESNFLHHWTTTQPDRQNYAADKMHRKNEGPG